jgi:hypothetical protein
MLAALAALGLVALARAANRQVRWNVPDWRRLRSAAEDPSICRSGREAARAADPAALQIVLVALRKRGRLIERSALTHRELATSATDLNERERQVLENDCDARGAGHVLELAADGRRRRRDRRTGPHARTDRCAVKEKLFVFLTVLLAAYVLYGMFVPPGIDSTVKRPLSTESGPFGYQGLWRWLAAEKIGTQSFRDRYYVLADPKHPLAGPGHVMIVSIPYLVTPDRDELDALLQ